MSKLKEGTFLYQITHFTLRQVVLMVIGHIILAFGAVAFAFSALGSHPFYTMLYAGEMVMLPLSPQFTYANLMVALNIVCFIIQCLCARRYIGIGTLFNAFLYPYIYDGCARLLTLMNLPTELLAMRIVLLAVGTLLLALGISLYQAADVGVAPYDTMAFVIQKYSHLPFFWSRMILDGTCLAATAIILLSKGVSLIDAGFATIGVGTVISVFCTGPFIRFFDRTISYKLAGRTDL